MDRIHFDLKEIQELGAEVGAPEGWGVSRGRSNRLMVENSILG